MKSLHYYKRKIKHLLFPKTEVNGKYQRTNRRVATLIKYILEYNDINIVSIYFTDITVKETKSSMIITCTMSRPGLFIGEHGKTIDMVKDYLQEFFSKSITIHIKEKFLFN